MIALLINKNTLGYMTFPQIRGRLENLFMSGFEFIAFFMALVYSAVNLLPPNHPYTQIENKGKYGIRHVIAEAANNLVLKKENIDQIILFVAILIGLALIIIQILLLGMGLLVQPVMASMPTTFAGFFVTQNPERDIAHIMMDLVFGVSDGTNHLFNSCVAQQIVCTESAAPGGMEPSAMTYGPSGTRATNPSIFDTLGFPFPIHTAMHQMFQFYNIGLLVVATLISLYFMVTVVAETAQTGTAFGKRFNKVWAPLRIVFAFGLLVPIGIGFNASQWIVLYAAKFGSAFASNGWNYFNSTLTDGYFGDVEQLASMPNIPEKLSLIQFMYAAKTCKYLEEKLSERIPEDAIRMYAVRGTSNTITGQPRMRITNATEYEEFRAFANGDNTIKIRFGEAPLPFDDTKYAQYTGRVRHYCGELILKLIYPGAVEDATRGIHAMQEHFFIMVRDLWHVEFNGGGGVSGNINYPENLAENINTSTSSLPEPDADYAQNVIDALEQQTETALTGPGGAIQLIAESERFNVNNMIREKGWAGAAIWYNRIAEMNGAVTGAAFNIPYPNSYPEVMEHVLREKRIRNANVTMTDRFHPVLRGSDEIQFRQDHHKRMAPVLWKAFDYWQTGSAGTSPHTAPTGNVMIDSINALFGTEGLYNIRRNPDTHPLAQLVGVGRGLIEASIRNLTISVTGGAIGSLISAAGENTIGGLVQVLSTFLVTVTMVGLTAGFILFYIVPFLPFLYFFFAIGGWVKGIFEAMVGAPLWALAHIRIDQNGLPGQAGVAGYFLIFEIFLRPILIIFGMLASISIFSALVKVLNQIFDLVTANLAGFDQRTEETGQAPTAAGTVNVQSMLDYSRSAIDQFFFTVIYTIIIYLMAMSSFKLIDLIPNNILRWMGQSTATFNDQREDAAQSLTSKATVGSQQTSSALSQGLKRLTGGG